MCEPLPWRQAMLGAPESAVDKCYVSGFPGTHSGLQLQREAFTRRLPGLVGAPGFGVARLALALWVVTSRWRHVTVFLPNIKQLPRLYQEEAIPSHIVHWYCCSVEA